MTSIFRTHGAAFLLAAVVGMAVMAPPLIAQHEMGSAYQGVHPLTTDDQLYYMARAHETLDGHPMLGNPYFYEDKNRPGVQFWIPDAVLASVGLFLFHSLYRGSIFWSFVLPFLDVLVLYAITYALTKKRDVSLGVASLLVLGFFFLPFNRAPNPQLAFLLFGAYDLLLCALKKRQWRYTVLAALLGGALFYVYPFYWTYWIVLLGTTFAASLLFLRKESVWKEISYIGIGTLICGIPYVISQYATSKLSYYQESLTRIGVIHTHFPSGVTVVLLSALVFALGIYALCKKYIPRNAESISILAASLAGVVVMNQHIVTGLNFQFVVHYTLLGVCFSAIALAYLFVSLLPRFADAHIAEQVRWWGSVALGVLGIVLVIPTIKHLATPQPRDISAERYGPVLSWLDAHTTTDDVVYANMTLSPYIPAYTRDNVFFSNWAEVSYLPQSEIETRYLGNEYFNTNFSSSTVRADETAVLGSSDVGIYQHALTENHLRKLFGLPLLTPARYEDARIASLVTKETQLQKGSFNAALAGYRADYVVWDTVADPGWNLAKVKDKTLVYAANGIQVYALHTPLTP